MKEEVETRIRVIGEGAERVRAYLTEKIPEAEIVGTGDPAEFVMTAGEDFNEAVEDAAAAAYARTRGEESLPIVSVDRLLSGESPVRVWLEHRRISLAALADQAGSGKGDLSQIENDRHYEEARESPRHRARRSRLTPYRRRHIDRRPGCGRTARSYRRDVSAVTHRRARASGGFGRD